MKLEDALKTTRFKDAKHKASLNILYTSYWLKNHFSLAIKGHGITMEQFNVMRILKGKYPEQMCIKDIGSRMIEKSSNVPRIIDKLVLKKLVKRAVSKEDKRETLVALTDKGIAQLNEANTLIDALSERIMGLDDNDALILNDVLDKMRKED